jgi:beta-phosphoglucomutase
LVAAKLLDVNPESIVFEDSVAGVQAANIGKMTKYQNRRRICYMKQNTCLNFTHMKKLYKTLINRKWIN